MKKYERAGGRERDPLERGSEIREPLGRDLNERRRSRSALRSWAKSRER